MSSDRKVVFQLERSFMGQEWEVVDVREKSPLHIIFQNPEKYFYDDGCGNIYRRISND